MKSTLPKKIIVFCLPGIGDAILFTPALAMLRRSLPDARITVMTMFRGTAQILETNPDVDEVRWFDFFNSGRWRGISHVWSLRRERFDLSIMPFPANRREYNIVNRLVGRRWRAGHRYRHQSLQNLWFLNNIVATEDGTRHNVEENIALVTAICRRLRIEPVTAGTELKVVLTGDDERHAGDFLRNAGVTEDDEVIGFHTYSSMFKNMHRKCWDKDNFVSLIRRLGRDRTTARFLIFSGPSDEAVNQDIMRQCGDRVSLVREPNLRHALAILKRCRAFVSNDSAIMHLASALRVPVVALFGPTDWRRLHPWSGDYRVIRRELPCSPCFYYSSRPLRCVAGIDYACMKEITVDEVATAIGSLIDQGQPRTDECRSDR
jgi:heptosyltransferase-2